MKKHLTITLTFVLLLILSLNLSAQQSYLCFPDEYKARKQAQRLNEQFYGSIWDKTIEEYVLVFKHVEENEHGFCIKVNCEDQELTYGRRSKPAIKKRHYKYIVIEDKAFFDTSNQCWLVHEPSKFQKFITKLKNK